MTNAMTDDKIDMFFYRLFIVQFYACIILFFLGLIFEFSDRTLLILILFISNATTAIAVTAFKKAHRQLGETPDRDQSQK